MTYLLCAESARLCSVAMLFGLLVNLVLNYILAPRFDLVGVVAATCAANAVSLLLVCRLSRWKGMRWDWGTVLAAALPMSLLLGGPAAIAVVLIVVLLSHRWIFNLSERNELKEIPKWANACLQPHRPFLDSISSYFRSSCPSKNSNHDIVHSK
jgi:O-antigen/teichoic acid export membrane protein